MDRIIAPRAAVPNIRQSQSLPLYQTCPRTVAQPYFCPIWGLSGCMREGHTSVAVSGGHASSPPLLIPLSVAAILIIMEGLNNVLR